MSLHGHGYREALEMPWRHIQNVVMLHQTFHQPGGQHGGI